MDQNLTKIVDNSYPMPSDFSEIGRRLSEFISTYNVKDIKNQILLVENYMPYIFPDRKCTYFGYDKDIDGKTGYIIYDIKQLIRGGVGGGDDEEGEDESESDKAKRIGKEKVEVEVEEASGKQKEKIEKLCKKHNVKLLILHGSYAKGKAHEDSDIDLALITKEKKPGEEIIITSIGESTQSRFGIQIQPHYFTQKEFNRSNSMAREVLIDGVKLL